MIYLSKLAKRLALAGPHARLLLLATLAGACSNPEEKDFQGPNPSQPIPITSLSVEPKIGSAKPGEVIQFNATVKNAKGAVVVADVDWTATGGTISPTGSFESGVYGHFQVTARLRSNSLIADSARVGVFVNPSDVLKLSLTPDGTEITEGEGVQLEAVAELADGSIVQQPALDWSSDVGQVDGNGYFIAPELEGTYLVKAQAASGVSGTTNVVVRANKRNLERVEVGPGAVILTPGQTQQFTANGIWEDGYTKAVAVAWSSTGGTISGDGFFTAGSTPGNYRVIGRYKQGTQADTAFISITEPEIIALDVTPNGTSLMVGATQQYTATARLSDGSSKEVGATWATTGGTISPSGLYSATSDGDFMVRASVAGTTLETETSVNVTAAAATLTKVTLSPSSATVPTGTGRQFTVTGTYSDGTTKTPSVTWSATGGSVNTSGYYTAGTVLGNFRVIASSGSKADTSAITVSSADLTSLSITPTSASLLPGGTQQFTASGTWSNGSTLPPTVTWSATGGTINSSGLYTAGTSSGTYRVIGLHSAGRADTSLVTISPPAPSLVSLSLSPSSVSLTPAGTRQFSVSGTWTDGGTSAPSVTYTATGGTITSGGLYTAGTSTGTFRVIAKHSGGTKADTSSVTISPAAPTLQALTISPATTSLQTGGTRQFSVTATWSDGSTAAPGVTWSASSGTISAAGLYTAPGTAGSYKVIVKDAAGPKADTSIVTVTAPAVVTKITVTPGSKSIPTGATQQFTASATYSNGGTGTPTLAWTATGGTISSGGMYTASGSSGNYRVMAQASGTNVKDTAEVTLTSATPTVTDIVLSPGTVAVNPGGTVQFSLAPTWSDGATRAITATYTSTGGTISSSGLYTAGSATGTFRVIGGCSGCSVTDTTTVTIQASSGGASVSSLTISPKTITLDIGEVYQFAASARLSDGTTQSSPTVSWTAVGGGLTSSKGLYRAPSTAGTYTLKISHSSGAVDNATVTVVTPSSPYFSDNFDACGSINKTANSKGFRWSDSGGGTATEEPAISSSIGYNSSCSLRLRYEAGVAGDDGWSEQRFAFGKKLSEVYLGWYQYFPSGNEGLGPAYYHRDDTGPDNNKMLRLWDEDYSNSFVKTGYSTLPSTSTPGDDHLNPEITLRGSDNVSRSTTNIGPWPSIVKASNRGRWIKFVARVKLATSETSNDGVMQLWMDGAQVVNHTNLGLFSGMADAKNWIRNGYIMGWSNSGFNQTTSTFIDNFVISATMP